MEKTRVTGKPKEGREGGREGNNRHSNVMIKVSRFDVPPKAKFCCHDGP